MSKVLAAGCILLAAGAALGQPAEPPPYSPIANPLPDTLDQLYRDSLNLRISRIRVNQAGYRPGDRKFFYVVGSGGAFSVLDESGTLVPGGTLTATGQTTSGKISIRASNNAQLTTGGDTRYVMAGPEVAGPVFQGELPALSPGRYRIVAAGDTSAPFRVDERIYGWIKDALLKFYGANRSGNTDSWFHPPSHLKDGPNGDGSLAGGWYDCGDHPKISATMSFTMAMLGLTAAALPDRDYDHYGRNHKDVHRTDGIPDMLYEGRIGADFVLKSLALANGDPATMVTSVGGEADHSWWGQPQYQDYMPASRGGPVRALPKEPGANIMGRYAAGLAFLSRLYAPYDKPFADQCLAGARKLYDFGKKNRTVTNAIFYFGENSMHDDMALAAVALLWATRDTTYKHDLIANTQIGSKGNPAFPAGTFAGGWFAYADPSLLKGNANTSWASVHVPALWGFYRLILKDPDFAASVGIDAAKRLDLIEDVVFTIAGNIGALAGGSASIALPFPPSMAWLNGNLTYDPLWKINTNANQVHVWNRYVAGNSTDFFCYYDIAKDLQGLALPNTPATTDWKADQVRELLVRQMDFFLGVNPWDISQIYGVGWKNHNHPHHRGANPEGKNVPGAFYRYRPPVGGLHGGRPPSESLDLIFYDDFKITEVCIDGTSNLLIPVTGLAKDEIASDPPLIEVRIEYVGLDRAIIVVRHNRYGTALIRYGASAGALASTQAADSPGVEHRIVLTGLKPGTAYFFQAEVKDLRGLQGINDNGGAKFTFTTLSQPPGPAQIAQVKVCNVTHDSAEILWFTPNGEYDSKVVYGTSKPPTQVADKDVAGRPTRFHYVKIGGLKEKTQYWFSVESNGVPDNNGGQYYTFTTPVEHVEFDIRTVSYSFGNIPFLGLNVINQDLKAYDSLDLRVYLRATEAEIADLGAAVDIAIQYNEAGFQGEHFKGALDPLVQAQKPVKLEDTFDAATNTWYWYLSLPLGPVVMKSGSRFRLDVGFRKRNLPFDNNLLYASSTHVPGPADWSWGPHSRARGEPADYAGIKPGNKDDLDAAYWTHEKNAYVTVYRKGQFIYGFSPSRTEQSRRVSHYRMDARITSPLNHLPEDFKVIDQASSTVMVKGTVSITDAGHLTDIWVNGEKLPSVSPAAVYDRAADRWNLNIPVKLKPGGNEVDITLFGGADPACQGCVGCAFSNLHFHLEYRKANAFPSALALLDPAGAPLPPLAVIGQTRFLVEVSDRNGDATAAPDTLRVLASNANAGDTLPVTLVETGPRTGVFRSTAPVLVEDVPASATGAGRLAMAEGDTVWVVYADPTDSEDTSRAFLYTPATFPQPIAGWFLDEDADGAVDKAVVLYSKPLSAAPDSLRLAFPDAASARTLAGAGVLALQGSRVDATPVPPFAAGITGFSGDPRNSSRSFLTHEGKPRASVFTLADSAGPVLNRAVISPSDFAGRPDTLTVLFSEAVDYARAETHPFGPSREGAAIPASDLTVSGVSESQGGRLVLLLDPDSRFLIVAGDSLRIAAGIRDLPGNPASPRNRRVVVEGRRRVPPPVLNVRWDVRLYDDRGTAPGGAPFVVAGRDAVGNWIPVQGSSGRQARNCPASDCGAPIPADATGGISRPSLLVETDGPFRYTLRVVDNLGVYVAAVAGEVGPELLEETGGASAPIRKNPVTGNYELRLIWNGRAEAGGRAGTGAYIVGAGIHPVRAGAARAGVSLKRTVGLLRRE